MSKKKSLMFDFITVCRNPLGGYCYGCNYCYIHGAKGMKIRFEHIRNKYSGEPRLYEHILDERFKDDDFVFFCDCIDYLRSDIPDEYIRRIYEWIERNYPTNFLSLTKNPERYLEFKDELPINMYVGSTIESNVNYPDISNAPLQMNRISSMMDITNSINIFHYRRMISIEPILEFDLTSFVFYIRCINPEFVVIGYDNHKNKLPEPSKADTLMLIAELEKYGIKVIRKSIRKAWWEK